MQYGIWSQYFNGKTPEQAVDYFVEAGFCASEISSEHSQILLSRGNPEKAGRELCEYAANRGFSFPQGHLLLTVDIVEDGACDEMKRWLDIFVPLGVKAAVIHTNSRTGKSFEELLEKRAQVLRELARYVDGTQLCICLENLKPADSTRTAAECNALIDAAGGGGHLGICLDTDHLNLLKRMYGIDESPRQFIIAAGERLKALHISDNDGRAGAHLMPYGKGTVDWDEVMKALSDIGYKGLFNFEIPGESGAPHEILMAKLAYLRSMCEYMVSKY